MPKRHSKLRILGSPHRRMTSVRNYDLGGRGGGSNCRRRYRSGHVVQDGSRASNGPPLNRVGHFREGAFARAHRLHGTKTDTSQAPRFSSLAYANKAQGSIGSTGWLDAGQLLTGRLSFSALGRDRSRGRLSRLAKLTSHASAISFPFPGQSLSAELRQKQRSVASTSRRSPAVATLTCVLAPKTRHMVRGRAMVLRRRCKNRASWKRSWARGRPGEKASVSPSELRRGCKSHGFRRWRV